MVYSKSLESKYLTNLCFYFPAQHFKTTIKKFILAQGCFNGSPVWKGSIDTVRSMERNHWGCFWEFGGQNNPVSKPWDPCSPKKDHHVFSSKSIDTLHYWLLNSLTQEALKKKKNIDPKQKQRTVIKIIASKLLCDPQISIIISSTKHNKTIWHGSYYPWVLFCLPRPRHNTLSNVLDFESQDPMNEDCSCHLQFVEIVQDLLNLSKFE